MKSKATPDASKVFLRILDTLGSKNAPEAARKLGLSKQSVYDWQRNIPSIENLLKVAESGNTSLHWILTGTGERFVGQAEDVGFEIVLERTIRRIVKEEVAAIGPPLDLGTIDEFDVASAIQKYDNAVPVLSEWYKSDGLPIPKLDALDFSGWESLTIEEKIAEIRSARKLIDRQRKRRSHVSPKQSADT